MTTPAPVPVIIESPYAASSTAERQFNLSYARACLTDSLQRDEAPLASHLLYTQVLDDAVAAEREQGIRAGYAWWPSVSKVVFYEDLGWSPGMIAAKNLATIEYKEIEIRRLGRPWAVHVEVAPTPEPPKPRSEQIPIFPGIGRYDAPGGSPRAPWPRKPIWQPQYETGPMLPSVWC